MRRPKIDADTPIALADAARMLGVATADLSNFVASIGTPVRAAEHRGIALAALTRFDSDLAALRHALSYHGLSASPSPYSDWLATAKPGDVYRGDELAPFAALGVVPVEEASRITGVPLTARTAAALAAGLPAALRRVTVKTLTQAQLETLAAATGPRSFAAELAHLRRRVRATGEVKGQDGFARLVNTSAEERTAAGPLGFLRRAEAPRSGMAGALQ